jgi:hypothetical protein
MIKSITILILFFIIMFSGLTGNCQIFKKFGQKVKEEVDYRVHRKAGQKIDQGLDSALALPKKVFKTKSAEKNTAGDQSSEQNNSNTSTAGQDKKIPAQKNSSQATATDENDMSQKDGYVTLALSATSVFTGGNIIFTGESVYYKNYKQVEIIITGSKTKESKLINLSKDGKYEAAWNAPAQPGNFTVMVKGSDKKSSQSAQFNVYIFPELETWCDKNIEVTKKAYDKLKDASERLSGSIGSKDKSELDKKMADVKEKVDGLLKLFNDLNTAGKETAALVSSAKIIPPNLADNLSALNNKLAEQRKKMEQIEEYSNHEPADNTVCEYLVMLNEACAAFSVYTNIEGLAIKGILKNIVLDKVIPSTTGMVNQKANIFSQPNDFVLKETAKIYSADLLDVEGLNSKLGTAGFAGDIVQFATDFLMKKYCGIFKGTLSHNYNIEFRNSKGENWWTYGVETKAVLALRYPKEKAKGNIIKMKGTLEGNGTKFSFFEDLEKNDEFQEGSHGKIEVVPIKAYTPFSVSAATSELDVMGFGAIARGLATPAYFNIPIDAEYNVNENKIKIFLNSPIIDFSSAVSNQLVFLLIGGDLLPYVKRMSFPINKVYRTLGSVVRDNNEFDVKKDSKGNLSFSGKANKHLGTGADKIEHDLNFTISAIKQ